MRTKVSELYEIAKEKYSLTLHGGQSGLTNSAYWVYLAEDFQNMSFLKGGELVITTGLFTQSTVSLYDFIRALVMRNCSGILINAGKYLHTADITPEILEFCNANSFPIFSMPWEVHLADIMQDYCSLLLDNNQSVNNLNAAFQNALYQVPIHENILRTLNQSGFETAADYKIMAIQNLQNTTRLTLPLNSKGFKYHLFEHENLQILIYNSSQNIIPLNELTEMICFYDGIKLGIGDTVHSLTQIGQSCKRARFALAAAVFWNRSFVNFDDLGLFQILFTTSDSEILKKLYKRHLSKLEQHDADHASDYMNTLRIFLLSDCNILETAFRMHTHRNTIVYRIKKIKEILNTELDNSAVKFDLLMAFYIKEYFEI
ncbi:purine catabolism regulatory protein [Oxobacter pfennigii]|uniref:Purine catabolism regulatory protein n=1 Tax=Oxobacter pfennigii TaxID=36849 RepID=A0A0P9ADN2_9CLOT|nr:PucR family transcriptional regulator [Oxobacter pfennigii]KPU43260.1 purine catabolism regulatory protein [Oxobacter pfennigii]